MLGEGLQQLLASSQAITAILGSSATRADKTTGIFPVQMPEAAPIPAIVYSEIHGEGVMTLDGPDDLQFARMQFSCYGKNYADSKRLARALRRVLEKFTGALGEGTVIDDMHRVGEVDTFEDGPFIYHTPVDFEIAYEDLSS